MKSPLTAYHAAPDKTRAHIRMTLLDLGMVPLTVIIVTFIYLHWPAARGWELAAVTLLFLFTACRNDWHAVEEDYLRRGLYTTTRRRTVGAVIRGAGTIGDVGGTGRPRSRRQPNRPDDPDSSQ